MGRFVYAEALGETYRLDDRVLAHLELAVASKFRLEETFALTLDGDAVPSGTGYRVLWMHPSIALQFRYDSDRSRIAINPAWVAQLFGTTSADGVMRIVSEPDSPSLSAAPGDRPRPPLYG